MPQKRQAQGINTSLTDLGDDEKPKKRRVSLACDACRAAREKCDGARPRCGACAALDRPCSYTPATKKRGVQTGYLRAIELSLAWIFEQIPESERALHRLLAQPAPCRQTRALLGKGSAGHHLQKVWNETQVRKALDALLAATQNAPSDSSDNEQAASAGIDDPMLSHDGGRSSHSGCATSLTTKAGQDSNDTPARDRRPGTLLKLPSHWEHLMDVYVSYTHCWLPVVNPEALRTLAVAYGSGGVRVDLDGDRLAYSRHSELWAALAVASFQDAPYSEHEDTSELGASRIFHIARCLTPGDDETFDIHSISAIILHSIVFMGKGKIFAASLILGKAARLLGGLRLGGDAYMLSLDKVQAETAGMACSLLETLTSLSANQPAVSDICDIGSQVSQSTAGFPGFDQVWQPVPGAEFPEHLAQPGVQHPVMEPIRTLMQLHAFSTTLRAIVDPRLRNQRQSSPIGPDDLVQTLDPRFSYCSSLLSSSSTPMMPPAFLIKLLFLTMTIELASHPRSSLLAAFLETAESCVANFGASRTPPVVALLLQIARNRARMGGARVGEAEQSSWRLAEEKLHSTWQDDPGWSRSSAETRRRQRRQQKQHQQRHSQDVPCKTLIPMEVAAGQILDGRIHPGSSSPTGPFGRDNLAGDEQAGQSRFGYQQPAVSNPSYVTPAATPFAAHPGAGGEDGQLAPPGGHRIGQSFDYDALLDIGSMDYSHGVEMDTRFMMNLGFAPGSDLAEMFQDDCGV